MVFMHDRCKKSKGLFFWHLYGEKSGYEKTLALAVSDLGVVKGVSFADAIQGFLSCFAGFLKVLMSGECPAFFMFKIAFYRRMS